MSRTSSSVFLVTFLWMLTVSRADTEVSCVFMERCILPCSFQVGPHVVIHWFYFTKEKLGAYSYYDNQDQLGNQHQLYRNRTSLFKDQISRGNTSLQLTGVTVQDEGRYQCYTRSNNSSNESFINLKVDAPVHKVNIQQVGNRIICSSEGIYPQPELTWSTRPPSNMTLQNTTTVQQPEQQLYSITSSLILSHSDTDLVYSCSIKTRRNKKRAAWRKLTPIHGSTNTTTITCAASNFSFSNLIWRFNHSQMIMNHSRTDNSSTVSEEWRQHVKNVSESGDITLQNLSSDQEGIYTCELSNTDETLITDAVVKIKQDTEVSCVFMERCILPCSFQVGLGVVIHWFYWTKGDLRVHSYYHNQDQLEHQHQLYRNRTSLFKDQISRGNASLQLTGVTVQDEGRYQCYTRSVNGEKFSFINLKVHAPVHKVSIQQVGNRIICTSEGIYPQPELTWSTRPPSNMALQNTTTVQQPEQQLYSITSSLILSHSDTDLVYSCSIKTRRNKKRAAWRKLTPIHGSTNTTTITCAASNFSFSNLIWTFNHSQMIMNYSRTDNSSTVSEEWRQQVKNVSESGHITLQNLSSDQEGIYTCELSNADETLITDAVVKIKQDTEVSCVFMERCILPCSFQVGLGVVIHWFYWTKGDLRVHSYYHNQDQLGHQHQLYRNRTSLFVDQISRGNTSLQLTGVKVQDEGRYFCYTRSVNGEKFSFINLKVDAPVHKVSIQQVGNRIICSSEGIYPQPELTWSTRPSSNMSLQNTTTVQQPEQQLYSITSSLILSHSDTDLVYSCTIKTRRNKKRAAWRKLTPIHGSTNTTIITCAASNFSFSNLIWTFNHSQMIMNHNRTHNSSIVSEEWRQHVKNVSESGDITLQNLSSDQEGIYTCELSNAEETLITDAVVKIKQDTEVSCVFMERCILPCSFQVSPHVNIHWFYWTKGDVRVHSYYHNQDQLGNQHQLYRNRTSLFEDQISRGNTSLQLTGVKVQDEGRYFCYTRSNNGDMGSFINLKVDAPVHKVNIQQVGNRIICTSEGIYPQPELTWSTRPPSNMALQNTTTVQQPEQQLYSITSSLILSHSDTDLVYSCSIKTQRNKKRAAWRKLTPIHGSTNTTIIACAASNFSFSNLIWTFNHSQMIMNHSRTDNSSTVSEEWRQHVKNVSESGHITLQNLSSDQEGIYTCELGNTEETLITDAVVKIKQDTEVSCVFMERCILPCSFQVGPHVNIHWFYWTKGDVRVHSYYHNQDQLKHQDQLYRNRTSLFEDQISRGNASLQLTGVKVQDEGRYFCHTRSNNGDMGSFINLKVDAPVHKVSIQQVGNRIICTSEGIYPQPELTWSTRPPSNMALQNTTTVQQPEQQLYSITSSLILSHSDTDLVYSCSIKTQRNKKRAAWRKLTPIHGSTNTTIIACAASNFSFSNFIWRFNHSQMIMNHSRTDNSSTVSEEWRQHVKNVSESGDITLQNLSSDQEGIYTCELSNAEETLITDAVVKIKQVNVAAIAAGVVVPILVIAGLVGIYMYKKKKDVKKNGYVGGTKKNDTPTEMDPLRGGGGSNKEDEPAQNL